VKISSIGTVRSTRKEVADDHWLKEDSYIELNPDFTADSIEGLADFSHVEILFYMNQVDPQKIESTARHPRNNANWPKVGIFAQRGKNRPNQIGLTICEIAKVEGNRLFVRGLDAVDGSPVLDIKPWMKEFGPRGPVRQPRWSSELMREYWEPAPSVTEPSMFDPVILNTEHVKIRPLTAVTWEQLAQGLLYEGSFHAVNWGIKNPDDIRRLYENGLAAWESKRGNPIVFLNQDESEVLGMTNFMNVEPSNKMIEIGGTWIHQKHQRSFVNTETKLALLQYAFEVLKLNRVEFRIDSGNLVSQRAVQRLGFHLDGLMTRRKINANGHVRDYLFFSVTDQTWPQVKMQTQHLQNKSQLPEHEVIRRVKDLRRQGQADLAFEAVLTGITSFPDSPHLHYLAASICDAYRTENEAVPFYLRALELGLTGEDRRDAFLGLASTYRSLGRYEESKTTFEAGIHEFPNYAPYKVFLALTEFNLKHPDRAVQLLLEQLLATTADTEIRSYERALNFYSTRLNEVFE